MAILEVENIYKSFGQTTVLSGIGFSVEKGQAVTVIGSSGSGKTTLLRCLNFLERPDKGVIRVNGREIFNAADKTAKTEKQLRENRLHFGLVFQSFNLFPQYTVLRNLTLAKELYERELPPAERHKKEQLKGEAMTWLKEVGLAHKADAYPCQLSGGQQQRVAIARALNMDPDILCFDEPTSALDPELTGEVLRVIRELKNDNTTMIIVTHEMDFARDVSDRVIFMANGIIEEQGTPEHIFGDPQSPVTRAFLSRIRS